DRAARMDAGCRESAVKERVVRTGPPRTMVAENRRKLSRSARLLGQALGAGTPQSTGARPGLHAVAVPLGKSGNGKHVGNAASPFHVLRGPRTARRLKDD